MKASKTKLGAANALVPEPKGKDPRRSSKRLRPSMAGRQQALNHALEAYNMGSLFAGEKDPEAILRTAGGLSMRSWRPPNHMDVPQKTRTREFDRAYLEHCRSIQERIVQSVFGNHYQTVAYYNH